MFDFNRWADWLEINYEAFRGNGLSVVFQDTRHLPECALNPCFGIDVETAQRVGNIRIWQVGLCDYQVLDFPTEVMVADEHMVAANDDAVPNLIETFISYFAERANWREVSAFHANLPCPGSTHCGH